MRLFDVADTAFKFGEKVDDPLSMYLNDVHTVTANLAGVPRCSMVSLQSVATWFQLLGPFWLNQRFSTWPTRTKLRDPFTDRPQSVPKRPINFSLS
jgi:hypothetical protein